MRVSRRSIGLLIGASGLAFLAGASGACATSSDDTESGAGELNATPAGALQTLNDLASFGEKRVGTPEGAKAANYLVGRFQRAGLQNVHFEEFNFPMHIADVPSSSFQVTQNGQPIKQIAFDVFEGSGNGRADNAPMIYVGSAKPEDLQGKDLHGKIAFVKRDTQYHRSSQYRNVSQAGALAMLYESAVPGNQIQIGSIRETWEAMGPIPTITIGGDDGDKLRCLLGEGNGCQQSGDVRATIDVKAHNAHGTGRNVVGIVPGVNFGKRDANGQSLDHQLVFGAHYDTWYIGSADNGCGVAALLGLAETRGRPATPPPYTLVFVAYDGEEVALYGGYDYLRKHQNDGLLAVVNFEIPAAETDILTGGFETLVAGVATSKIPVIEESLLRAQATGPFTAFAIDIGLNFVAKTFGGIIPTDIQGTFRSGIPTISTASSTPWYHTRNDTPDKVDTGSVVRTVNAFSRTTDQFLSRPVQDYRFIDGSLWTATLAVFSATSSMAQVGVSLAKADGTPLPNTNVTGTLFCDDFFAAPDVVVRTDAQAHATFTWQRELQNCKGKRWVHITAGESYPLVEKVVSLDGVGAPNTPSAPEQATPAITCGSIGSGCIVQSNCCVGQCVKGLCQ
jgi:Iap family predicted aminopeptidase